MLTYMISEIPFFIKLFILIYGRGIHSYNLGLQYKWLVGLKGLIKEDTSVSIITISWVSTSGFNFFFYKFERHC